MRSRDARTSRRRPQGKYNGRLTGISSESTAMPPPHALDLHDSTIGALATTAGRRARAVVGFDGFIDDMASVIDQREAGAVRTVPTIAAFGAMVSAAAGRSFGREILVKRIEAGGNAPNLADGLCSLGHAVDFYGTLGDPLDPVFADFARRCASCTTLGACGRTLALEFGDGKLMLNNTGRLAELTPAIFHRLVDAGVFIGHCERAELLGFVNWSRYPHMTACWEVVTDRVLSRLTHRPWVLVDLADPAGRSPGEIIGMLAVVSRMARTCRVAFGANLNETGTLLRAIGAASPTDDPDSMTDAAESLRTHLGAHLVAVHSQRRAGAAWADPAGSSEWRAGRIALDGAYNPAPVRTTGVGDRFNAGIGAALIAGAPPANCLSLGCIAGAWFVTAGRPLELADLPEARRRLSK